jgi:predicted HicB family RNase H-like nuclease
MATSPGDRVEQPMYVRLPVELHRAVKERANAEDRTMAQTIRVALRHYLQTTRPVGEQF